SSGSQGGSSNHEGSSGSQGGSNNQGSQNGSEGKPSSGSGSSSEADGKISFDVNSVVIKENEEQEIKVVVNNTDVTAKADFTSLNDKIAEITKDNKIKGKSAGVTKVIVSYNGDMKVLDVYVIDEKGSTNGNSSSELKTIGMEVSPNEITLEKGENKPVSVLEKFEGDIFKDVTSDAKFDVEDQKVAFVSGGKVYGIGKGKTKVTVTWNGYTADCTVEVKETETAGSGSSGSSGKVNVSQVIVNPEKASVVPGKAVSLQATVLPSNASDSTVTWTANSDAVIVYQNGNAATVYANPNTAGKTVIVTATAGNQSANCVITITKEESEGGSGTTDNNTYVKSISIPSNCGKIVLNQKASKSFTAKVQPINVKEKGLKVSTKSKTIATVSYNAAKSKVTIKAGKKAGATTITLTTKAKTANGKYVTKNVLVTVKPAKVSSLKKKAVSKNAIKLTWKKQSGVTGYQVSYKLGSKKVTKTIKKNSNSYTLKGLKANKKYSIQVRAYYQKKGYTTGYGDYSKAISVTTKK
ncbi:MAG: Ig-like domain-containing protein, partial [Lachnospiraceae bacterium]